MIRVKTAAAAALVVGLCAGWTAPAAGSDIAYEPVRVPRPVDEEALRELEDRIDIFAAAIRVLVDKFEATNRQIAELERDIQNQRSAPHRGDGERLAGLRADAERIGSVLRSVCTRHGMTIKREFEMRYGKPNGK
jgi:hypothetical protein